MWSLADTLQPIASRLPAALHGSDALVRAHAVLRALPASLSNCFFLELWLPDGVSRVDVIVRLGARGRRMLAADPAARDSSSRHLGGTAFGGATHGAAWRDGAAWDRIAAFARAWEGGDPLVARSIAAAWIEFDLDAADDVAPAIRRPRVFVDFTPDAQRVMPIDDRLRLMGRALQPLLGRAIGANDPSIASLRTCLAALPPHATVPYLGVAPADARTPLRFCVMGLGADTAVFLGAYLPAIAWPGDSGRLTRDPLAWAGAAAMLHLDIDAAGALAPRLGLEYAFAREPQRRGDVREQRWLQALVVRGWCTPGLRDDLARWPGRSSEWLPHEIWESRVSRRLSHVKLTSDTQGAITAKAYLCAFHELHSGGTLVTQDRPLFVPAPADEIVAARDERDAGGWRRPSIE